MIADDDVANFAAMTGASGDEARQYLEMVGGDMQQAVNLFFEGGGALSASPPASAPVPSQPSQADHGGLGAGGIVDDDVAAEVRAAAAAAGIDMGPMGADALMEDAEEVRAPIASYQDQIINSAGDGEQRRMQEAIQADSAAMSKRMAFARAEAGDEPTDMTDEREQAMNDLFAPPEYNEPLPYYSAIEKAKSEGKWILVNIQQAEVFASHTLNRDVWRDETISDIMNGNFLFWQRDDKSTEGDRFCQYHQCGSRLPHICIIDPRTGRKLKSWEGRKWVESHAAAEYLTNFLDEFSMSRSPPANSPAGSPSIAPQAEPSIGDVDNMRLVGFDQAEAQPTPMEVAEPKEQPAEMPEEPPEGAEALKVSFRLPSGARSMRRFLKADPTDRMFDVASALAQEPKSSIDLSTQFPKRSLRELPDGLATLMSEAQVAGNMILITVRK